MSIVIVIGLKITSLMKVVNYIEDQSDNDISLATCSKNTNEDVKFTFIYLAWLIKSCSRN